MSAVSDATAKLTGFEKLGHAVRTETRKTVHSRLRKSYVGRIVSHFLPGAPSKVKKPRNKKAEKPTADVTQHVRASTIADGLAQSTQIMLEGFAHADRDIGAAHTALADSADAFGENVENAARSLRDALQSAMPQRTKGTNWYKPQPERVTKKASATPNSSSVTQAIFRSLAGFKGPARFLGPAARFIGPVIAGLAGGVFEYMQSGSLLRGGVVGSSIAGGAVAGASLGFALGSMVPVIGNLIGAVAGFALGAGGVWLGQSLAETGLDYFAIGKTSPTNNDAPQRTSFNAAEIKFDVKDEIKFINRLGGDFESDSPSGEGTPQNPANLNFMERAFKNLGLPLPRDLIPPSVRKALGVDAAGETVSTDKGSRAADDKHVSTNGKEVPPEVIANAESLLRNGASNGQLQQFMTAQGYPMHSAWCGDFAASVVKYAGGTPPEGASLATNWLKYGEHVDPKDAKPGDVVVIPRGHGPGESGGHVGFLKDIDTSKGTLNMVGGNQGGHAVMPRQLNEVEIRRASPPPEAPPPAAADAIPSLQSPAPASPAADLTPPAPAAPATGIPTKQSMMPGAVKAPRGDKEDTKSDEDKPFQGSFLDMMGTGITPYGGY